MLLELGPLRGCACSLSLVLLVAVLGPPLHVSPPMTDGSSCHQAAICKQQWAEYHIKTQEHPLASPDLNPIENIWSRISRKVEFQQGLSLSFYDVPSSSVLLVLLSVAWCHGPGCSRSRRVTGSYGRSTGIEDLVNTSIEHGRSAVSMETMDSYGLTCKGGPSHMRGGPGTATRRTKLKEQAQPRRGPSSRSMQMVTTQGLERQESKELTPGHEEEEQCRRSRHHSGGTRVPNKQQDSKEEEQCRRSRHSSRGTGVPSKQERPLNSTR
ncbi:hypothetical protein NDA17_005737 [Ustilago hordei]|nr:hypothetical protein NDA17_005737 [Ustilago hordei]